MSDLGRMFLASKFRIRLTYESQLRVKRPQDPGIQSSRIAAKYSLFKDQNTLEDTRYL